MRDFGDVNKLILWAAQNGLSVSIIYWESSGEMSIEVFSAAPSECYAMKRTVSVDYFIEKWNEHMKNQRKEK